jgi:Uma2 family endonuclease
VTGIVKSKLPPLTFEAYLAHDDGTDTQCELRDGTLVEMPPESIENSDVARRLLVELLKFVPLIWLSYKEIEIEVSGRSANTRLPDLMILGDECRTALQGKTWGTITGDMPPPLIAIEVISPGHENEARDYRYKRSEYAARGIAEYWIVNPQKCRVTVLLLVEGLYEETVYSSSNTIVSTVLPQVQVEVKDIFQKS